MKKLIAVLLFLPLISFGQNLVPNGSFERIKTCCISNIPNVFNSSFDTLIYNWSQSNFGGKHSNEIYNSCFFDTIWPIYQSALSTPGNYWGYQIPRTGNGYCGSCYGSWPYSYVPNNYNYIVWSEFPAIQLNSQLQQGVQYKARFNVSLADSCYFGTDAIGMHITADTLTFDSVGYMNLNLQVSKKGTCPVLDTGSWISISSVFTAIGGEQFLILGSFESDSAMLKIHRSGYPGSVPTGLHIHSTNIYIYYYIDDVSVWRADTIPPASNTGTDTTICLGGKAKLGEHHYGDYYYEWFTKDSIFNNYTGLLQNGFMKYSSYLNFLGDSGFISVSPTQTTTYYCLATDFTYTKTLDSVTVYVIDCGHANDTTVCIEQSFTLGTLSLPQYSYKWSPATFLNYDTIGQPLCTPTNNITYSLIIKNSTNDTVSLDTTTIFVGACHYAQAGIDTTICKGDSMQIGSHNYNFVSYLWSPNFMLSDTAVGNPLVWPDTSTYYFLQVTDTMGNISFDSVLVGVQNCDTVGINELSKDNFGFECYPNPANNKITLEFKNEVAAGSRFVLYSLDGKLLIDKQLDAGEKIFDVNISMIENGVYIYNIINNNCKGKNNKLVIMR